VEDSLANVIIREARLEDAERIIAYIQGLTAEPDIDVVLGPGEFDVSVEDEHKFIRDHAADNSILLVGEAGEQIIAVLNCTGGRRKATRHEARLGISVHKEWRNRGLGHRLMARAVEWARGTGIITRVELEVFARNAPAIHLYEKFGFATEGRRRRAFYKNGEYIDSLIMALLL
jgi:RimJ/RimL family protein N-acetyltransferase